MTRTPELARLEHELRDLLGSFEYAYAMGHGCSLGDHPEHRAVREHAADLHARIAELRPSRPGAALSPRAA